MGMSTYIKGVRDLSIIFDKMAKVKEACDIAKVDYPQEVKSFFGKYYNESIEHLRREMEECDITFVDHYNDSEEGWEVDLSSLPEDVVRIRFINSY